MQRRAIAEHGREAGGSAVSFVMVLPILVTLLCAIVDFGRLAFVGAELEGATQSACKWACAEVSLTGKVSPTDREIVQVMKETAPSLGLFGSGCSAKLQCLDVSETTYLQRSFNAESESFDEHIESMPSLQVSVSSTLEGAYLTPLGSLLSQKGDGTFSLSAQAVRTVHVGQGSFDGEG